LRIGVVGGGIGGLSAAWLLSQRHQVVLFEAEPRLGGHANTVDAPGRKGPAPVDTGFIVYNEANYPNFTALLKRLGVATQNSDMGLSVSLDDGALEYSSHLAGIFAQGRNLFSRRFWGMLRDVKRFCRHGEREVAALETPMIALGDYLEKTGYCRAFQEDHLLPQAAAIWSTPMAAVRDYPAAALIRFFRNHGMMRLTGRARWRTVAGGSRTYVEKLAAEFRGETRKGVRIVSVRRDPGGVEVRDSQGRVERFDHLVIGAHADQALAMLDAPTAEETRLLGAFAYSRNLTVLHSDRRLMPRRRLAWSSWNHVGRRAAPEAGCVTYWMNQLQSVRGAGDLFVTLNPTREIDPETVIRTEVYDHPLFNAAALAAQAELWSLQGVRRTWFCGSYFGHGFHEDALQSGLAAAEQLGGVRRPWDVADESGRICLGEAEAAVDEAA
jgi:predicted NAD/FAD-binding protein